MYYTIRIRLKTKETRLYTSVSEFKFEYSPRVNCPFLTLTDLITGGSDCLPYMYSMRDVDEILIKPQC